MKSHRGRRPWQCDINAVLLLYKDGWSLSKLGKKFGVSGDTIKAAILRYGYKLKGFEETVNQWRYDPLELRSLYLDKKFSLLKISKMAGVSFTAVRHALIREGITARKRNTQGLRYLSEETKNKIGLANSGVRNGNYGKKFSLEEKEHLRKIGLGRKLPKEAYIKASMTRINKGLSKGDLNPMSKPENVRKWIIANKLKPNKAEIKLKEIIDKVAPGEYDLNVDGHALILRGKIPDFVNIRGRAKLIELFGDFWHRGEDPNHRISLFKESGYDTLVIWEHELIDPMAVTTKLKIFNTQ